MIEAEMKLKFILKFILLTSLFSPKSDATSTEPVLDPAARGVQYIWKTHKDRSEIYVDQTANNKKNEIKEKTTNINEFLATANVANRRATDDERDKILMAVIAGEFTHDWKSKKDAVEALCYNKAITANDPLYGHYTVLKFTQLLARSESRNPANKIFESNDYDTQFNELEKLSGITKESFKKLFLAVKETHVIAVIQAVATRKLAPKELEKENEALKKQLAAAQANQAKSRAANLTPNASQAQGLPNNKNGFRTPEKQRPLNNDVPITAYTPVRNLSEAQLAKRAALLSEEQDKLRIKNEKLEERVRELEEKEKAGQQAYALQLAQNIPGVKNLTEEGQLQTANYIIQLAKVENDTKELKAFIDNIENGTISDQELIVSEGKKILEKIKSIPIDDLAQKSAYDFISGIAKAKKAQSTNQSALDAFFNLDVAIEELSSAVNKELKPIYPGIKKASDQYTQKCILESILNVLDDTEVIYNSKKESVCREAELFPIEYLLLIPVEFFYPDATNRTSMVSANEFYEKCVRPFFAYADKNTLDAITHHILINYLAAEPNTLEIVTIYRQDIKSEIDRRTTQQAPSEKLKKIKEKEKNKKLKQYAHKSLADIIYLKRPELIGIPYLEKLKKTYLERISKEELDALKEEYTQEELDALSELPKNQAWKPPVVERKLTDEEEAEKRKEEVANLKQSEQIQNSAPIVSTSAAALAGFKNDDATTCVENSSKNVENSSKNGEQSKELANDKKAVVAANQNVGKNKSSASNKKTEALSATTTTAPLETANSAPTATIAPPKLSFPGNITNGFSLKKVGTQPLNVVEDTTSNPMHNALPEVIQVVPTININTAKTTSTASTSAPVVQPNKAPTKSDPSAPPPVKLSFLEQMQETARKKLAAAEEKAKAEAAAAK